MTRRSFVPALALFASLAFAAPTQAATILVSEAINVTTLGNNNVTSIDLKFTGLNGISGIQFLGTAFSLTPAPVNVIPSFTNNGVDTITINLSPGVFFLGGSITFLTTAPTTDVVALKSLIKFDSYTLHSPPGTVVTSDPTFTAVAAVPEPTSSAMFGIGIALAVGLGWNRKRREVAKLAA